MDAAFTDAVRILYYMRTDCFHLRIGVADIEEKEDAVGIYEEKKHFRIEKSTEEIVLSDGIAFGGDC